MTDKILFVGTPERGYFVDEIASQVNCECDYISDNGHIKYQTNEILAKPGTKYMVFDIEQYIDDSETISTEIINIRNCNNAKPIIYAAGYTPAMTIIVDLVHAGLKNFIFSTNLTDMKDQLIKCINGYYEVNGIEELNTIQLADVEEETKEKYNFKLIGVAGSMNRIGTTTQAVHIVKYLNSKGYKACFIHMNNTDYINQMQEWYNAETDNDMGKMTYENVDHFYKVEKISDIKKLGYDYYVYDYGCFFNPDFNKISFLEKDIKIFVIGFKAGEMQNSYHLIDNAFYDDVKYIMSFGDELSDEDMKELMAEKADNTIIPKRCSEPYVLSDINCYEKIIPVETVTEAPKKKKKSLWGRK